MAQYIITGIATMEEIQHWTHLDPQQKRQVEKRMAAQLILKFTIRKSDSYTEKSPYAQFSKK